MLEHISQSTANGTLWLAWDRPAGNPHPLHCILVWLSACQGPHNKSRATQADRAQKRSRPLHCACEYWSGAPAGQLSRMFKSLECLVVGPL